MPLYLLVCYWHHFDFLQYIVFNPRSGVIKKMIYSYFHTPASCILHLSYKNKLSNKPGAYLSTIILTIAALISCHRSDVKMKSAKIYGCPYDSSRMVVFDVSREKTFNELYCKVEQTVCNDSLPALSLLNGGHRPTIISLVNLCRENYGCILIKRRNEFKIVDDSLEFEKKYPMDSLEVLMKRHYGNGGKSPYHAEDAASVILTIEYKKRAVIHLNDLLKRVLAAWEKMEGSECLNLCLESSDH